MGADESAGWCSRWLMRMVATPMHTHWETGLTKTKGKISYQRHGMQEIDTARKRMDRRALRSDRLGQCKSNKESRRSVDCLRASRASANWSLSSAPSRSHRSLWGASSVDAGPSSFTAPASLFHLRYYPRAARKHWLACLRPLLLLLAVTAINSPLWCLCACGIRRTACVFCLCRPSSDLSVLPYRQQAPVIPAVD